MRHTLSEFRWLLGCILKHPSNRGHRFSAFCRFAWWQIRKRLFKRPVIIRVGETRRFKVVCDSPFSSTVIYNALPDWDEMNFLLRFLRPSDGFIDIGANVGFYTVLASTIVNQGPLLAFEANPRNAEVLRDQVELNSLENAEVFCTALGNSAGEISFIDSGRETGSIAEGGASAGKLITVPCARLDDCLDKRALPDCVVAKMDVEGCEALVLEGARKVMENGRITIWLFELNNVALHEHGNSAESLLQMFSQYGYSIAYWDEDQQRIGRRGDKSDTGRANYLACRDIGSIERRVLAAPPQKAAS